MRTFADVLEQQLPPVAAAEIVELAPVSVQRVA
jgi:hypothetical protein